MEEEGLWDDYAIKQRDKKVEKVCGKVDGEWTKEGCVTDSDGPKADKFHEELDKEEGATIQDWEYGVIPFQTPEPEDDKVKQEDSPPIIEDYGNTVTEEEQQIEDLEKEKQIKFWVVQ